MVILYKDKIRRNFFIHQLVSMAFHGHDPCGMELVVDHINEIKTDNRASNLRIVTNRFNVSFRKGCTSKYTGVSFENKRNKWVSNIQINGKSKHLGYFHNEIDAHHAYQRALSEIS